MKQDFIKTHDYIKNRFKDAIFENHEGEYALPYPFVPPCIDGLFKCLFYWDTYYTNIGLIIDGYKELAKNNVDNLLYLLDKYGYVPNSNSEPGIKHNSQPPYLNLMVKDIYKVYNDEEWLKKAYDSLKKEYKFWMKERITPIGLNRYYHHQKTKKELIEFYDYVSTRLDIDKNLDDDTKAIRGSSYNGTCESGLDFTPRFNYETSDICPIDLNCLLYMFELNMYEWASKFDKDNKDIYINNANKRKELINKYLYNPKDGLYYDYNYVKKTFETLEFNYVGQFFPYISNINTDKEKCLNLLQKVEYKYGIASTSEFDNKIGYQAAYPYSWPYDNGIAFWALTNLSLKSSAIRVGNKYLTMCANSYIKYGELYETYDATKNDIATKKEYPNKEMMGWTAGIYEWIYKYVKENE